MAYVSVAYVRGLFAGFFFRMDTLSADVRKFTSISPKIYVYIAKNETCMCLHITKNLPMCLINSLD